MDHLQDGFRGLIDAFGVDDPNSPARIYARRAAALMREHGTRKLEKLPTEALEELEGIVANAPNHNGSARVATPPPAARQRQEVPDIGGGFTNTTGPLNVVPTRIEIVQGFAVEVDGDRVTLFHREPAATYTIGQALAIANILRHVVETEAGVVKATPNGARRVLPKSG